MKTPEMPGMPAPYIVQEGDSEETIRYKLKMQNTIETSEYIHSAKTANSGSKIANGPGPLGGN